MNAYTKIACLGGPADGAEMEYRYAPSGFFECVQDGSDARHRYYLSKTFAGWRWRFVKSDRPATQDCKGR